MNAPTLPRSNSRYYELGGRKYWRVTTLLSSVNKPALIQWAANMERTTCLEAAGRVVQRAKFDFPSPGHFISAVEAELGNARAHVKEMNAAMEIGSQAHKRMEWCLRGKVGPEPECSEKALWASMAGEDWLKRVNFKPRFVEQTIWSDHHGYAGTMDFDGEGDIPGIGRALVLGDFKTGKAIYPEAKLQVAAYRQALIEMGHASRPLHAVVLRLPKVVGDPEFEAVVLHDAELHALFPSFLAAKVMFEFLEAEDATWKAKRKAA